MQPAATTIGMGLGTLFGVHSDWDGRSLLKNSGASSGFRWLEPYITPQPGPFVQNPRARARLGFPGTGLHTSCCVPQLFAFPLPWAGTRREVQGFQAFGQRTPEAALRLQLTARLADPRSARILDRDSPTVCPAVVRQRRSARSGRLLFEGSLVGHLPPAHLRHRSCPSPLRDAHPAESRPRPDPAPSEGTDDMLGGCITHARTVPCAPNDHDACFLARASS